MKHSNFFLNSLVFIFISTFCLIQNNAPLSQNNVNTTVEKFSVEKQSVLNQLSNARKSEDLERANIQLNKLNEIDGACPVFTPSDARWHTWINPAPSEIDPDYMWYTIHSLGTWANAVCTEPVGATHAGRIWVAATEYATGGDSCKLYYSDNNGNSWSYYAKFFGAFNFDFRTNELEIIPVWDGTTAWLFGVAAYTDLTVNQSKGMLFRFNLTTGMYYFTPILLPGNISSENNYYNPRITSDNIAYPASTYLFMMVALDSTTGSTHSLKTKSITCSNPTATTPSFDYTQPFPISGGWATWNNQPANVYQYVDIGWYVPNNGDDMMYVSLSYKYYTGSPDNGNIHTYWSKDLGHSLAGFLTLTEPNPVKGTRIAFNGGTNSSNQNGMIVYLKNVAGADWDVKYYNTTSGGLTPDAWSNGAIDYSAGYASGLPDVIAIRGGSNTFKVAYSQGTSTTGSVRTYYSGFNGTSWSAPITVNLIEPDTTFACSRAGYLNGGGDDCLTIWRGSDNITRISKLCTSTIGIENNNEKPNTFHLSQNYPNPFNPTTDIKFSIPKTGLVTIIVYNSLGQKITTLINEIKQEGEYKVSFNGTDLPSGVYFYKISVVSGSDNYSDTKKMLIIK